MLRVLTYHRIADPEATPDLDPALVSATPEAFRKQMLHLRKWYQPVSLDEVLAAFLDGAPLPPRAVHVTVDDAYRDFAEEAWPILRSLDIPATVFVPTAYPGHRSLRMWWDRLYLASRRGPDPDAWRRAVLAGRSALTAWSLPEVPNHGEVRRLLRRLPHDDAERFLDLAWQQLGLGQEDSPTARSAVLSWDELRALQREGVTFGAHTVHHAALARVDEARIRTEIRNSLDDLDRELGPVARRALAYPYGSYDRRVSRIAREEGCALGFTCEDGLNDPHGTDPFVLRRTNITPRTSPPLFALRMLPWFAEVDRWRHRHERIGTPA